MTEDMRIEVKVLADKYIIRVSDGMELYGRTMVRTPTGAKGCAADGCKNLNELENENYELYCAIEGLEDAGYEAMKYLEEL